MLQVGHLNKNRKLKINKKLVLIKIVEIYHNVNTLRYVPLMEPAAD